MDPSLLHSNLSSQTKFALPLIFFLFLFSISIPKSCSATILQSNSNTNTTNAFIKTSCGVTLYPQLCYKTLIAYASSIQLASPMELANAALNISLKSTQSTSKTVLKLSKRHGLSPREAGAIMDCVETIGDSVDDLKKSMVAMNDLDGPDFEFKLSNVQTWVSAALTNEDTCMDGFEGKTKNMDANIRGIIRRSMKKVAQLTSISLALINKISSS